MMAVAISTAVFTHLCLKGKYPQQTSISGRYNRVFGCAEKNHELMNKTVQAITLDAVSDSFRQDLKRNGNAMKRVMQSNRAGSGRPCNRRNGTSPMLAIAIARAQA